MCWTEMAEWTELTFGTEATLGLPYIVFEGKMGISKNMGSLRTWSQTLDLEKFRNCTSAATSVVN